MERSDVIPLFPLNKTYKKLSLNLVGFFMPKKMPKNAPIPFLHTSTGVFQIAHISYFLSHFLVLSVSTKCGV